MKIIKPYAEVIDVTPDAIQKIERCGRVCYKSEDKITQDSAEHFVRSLVKSGHHSVLEHSSATIKFVTNRGVTHELVRHRIASFSQESTRYCVAGNSVLTAKNPHNTLTIEKLYLNKTDSSNGSWKRIKIRQLNEDTGELQYAPIEDVFYVGVKKTLKIRTKLGYEISTTVDHEIHTDIGFKKAEDFIVGDTITVNGSELLYRSRKWLELHYEKQNKTAVQIAKEFGFNVSTIKKWIKKHNLRVKPKSYWNVGRVPWNKGLSEHDDVRVLSQANAMREFHWDCGTNSKKTKIERVKKLSKRTYHKTVGGLCSVCKSENNLQVHHLDEDRLNNNNKNLITVCASCHQRIHAKNILVAIQDEITSIECVDDVPVYDISMNSKYHNFVANGVVVHNCNYSKDKFNNELTFIEPPTHESWSEELQRAWRTSILQAEISYFDMLKYGAKPQEARGVLPNDLKTEIVVTANFREWRTILQQRTSKFAHPDIKFVMDQVLTYMKTFYKPVFEDIGE